MHPRLKNPIALTLPFQILLVRWLASHPDWVETYYSRGLYPHISRFFRHLYGWLPFSVGDLCYLGVGVVAIGYLIRNRYRIRTHFWAFARDVVLVLSVIHFSFYLLWGMNYFRHPLLKSREAYATEDLVRLTSELARGANRLQEQLAGATLRPVRVPYDRPKIMEATAEAYQGLAADFPQYRYHPTSLKPSLFSTALSYMGYGGYLNPFTGEAQVNRRLPLFRYPVVCGHEVGHQLGYSAENETNFIGYLVTLRNPDPYFRYSAITYGLGYCLSEVYRRDREAHKALLGEINPGVRANFRELQEFWKAFENPLEPVFKSAFNKYLEINRQKDGIRSYDRVVALIVEYHRTHPVPGGPREPQSHKETLK